jgi:hypothetical protein
MSEVARGTGAESSDLWVIANDLNRRQADRLLAGLKAGDVVIE